MSASLGPNSPLRITDDAYITPTWAVWAVMPVVEEMLAGKVRPLVIDAGCGSGAISKVIAASKLNKPRLVGIDVRPVREEYMGELDTVEPAEFYQANFMEVQRGQWPDLVIMNPPYKLAMEFVQHALHMGEDVGSPVVALLRLNWLGAQKRSAWLREHPCHVAVLPRRPGFMPDKPGRTDGAEYAWFCWGDGYSKGTWEILHTRPAERYIARPRST